MYENIIRNYINAYNAFDVDKMVADLDESIRFENISNGKSTIVLHGFAAFKGKAERTKYCFSERKQVITGIKYIGERAEVNIDYEGKLAVDLPNGMLCGDTLRLKGISIFSFRNDKVTELIDYS